MQNLEAIGHVANEIQTKAKYVCVNFDRYLHIQDGIPRSWCYFMTLLVSHG